MLKEAPSKRPKMKADECEGSPRLAGVPGMASVGVSARVTVGCGLWGFPQGQWGSIRRANPLTSVA